MPDPISLPLFQQNPPLFISVKAVYDRSKCRVVKTFWHDGEWIEVPLDEHGVPSLEWLRWLGSKILKSEIRSEKHVSLCGKERYVQLYRVDTYEAGVKPRYQCGNETRYDGESLQDFIALPERK